MVPSLGWLEPGEANEEDEEHDARSVSGS